VLMLVDVVVVVVGTSAMLVSAMVEEEECAQWLAPWAKGYRIRSKLPRKLSQNFYFRRLFARANFSPNFYFWRAHVQLFAPSSNYSRPPFTHG
jgi:hypothetical protein